VTSKKINSIVRGGHSAKITYDQKWGEYVVRLDNNAKSYYFTNDTQDAIGTANAMVNFAIDHPNAKR
jgi:hypothetical protein